MFRCPLSVVRRATKVARYDCAAPFTSDNGLRTTDNGRRACFSANDQNAGHQITSLKTQTQMKFHGKTPAAKL